MKDRLAEFRSEYLNANSWAQRKDGVPLDLLDKLDSNELIIAEQELIQAASLRDSWPILGLGHIRSQKALPVLYELLTKASDSYKVIIAHSIFQINKDEDMISISLKELSQSGKWSEFTLIDIIYLLPDFHNDKVNRYLSKLTKSNEYLVAYNAARVLGRPTEPIIKRFRKKG